MAQEMIIDSQLRLIFDHGVNLDGEQVFKNKNFNNVKTAATPDELYAVTQALVPLQQHPLFKAERNNSYQLMNSTTTA